MPLSTPTGLLTFLAELPFFVSLAIKSLALLLLACLLHFYAKKRQPQWHVCLWRATAVALLLLPVIGLIRLPVLAQTQALQEGQQADVFVSATPPAADTFSASDAASSEQVSLLEAQAIAAAASVATPAVAVGVPAAVATKTDAVGEPSPSHFALGWWTFYGLWGAGIFVLLLRLLAGALVTGALLHRASPCSAHIRQLAETVAARSGIGKMPAIRETADLQTPALCNVLKPVLLIPKSMAADASTNELKAILSHELTHFKVNDLQWNLLIRVAAILYWVNPLVWRMRIMHLSACELLADAASARASGGADAYSRLLARIALSINAKRQHTGLAMARSANVLRRIRQLPITLGQTPIRRRWLVSALAAFALVCAATGSTLVVRAKTESPATQAVNTADDNSTITSAPVTPASAQQTGYMDVRVINTQGEPLADATLRASYYLEGERQQLPIAETGNGTFRLTLEEKMPGSLYLYSNASGYVTMRADWRSLETNAMPKQYTFQMEPATRIGGRVVNEEGDPVADATVKVSVYLSKNPTSGAADYSVSKEVTTNAEGIWSFDGIPPQLDADRLGLMVTHTGYAPLDDRYRYRDPINESSATVKAAWMEKLRNGTLVSTLKKGYHIAGQITLPDGSPAVGAEVGSGWSPNAGDGSWQTIVANAQGRYQFNNVPPISDSGKAVLTVINPDYAPAIRVVTLGADNNDTDIQLEAGNPVRIRVVDSEGKPLSDVSVHLSYLTSFEDKSTQYPVDSLFGRAPTRALTNAKGEFEWLWAPQDVVTYDFSKDGYMRLDGVRLNPSPDWQDWQTITLKPEMHVEATVVDAQTGKPIPSFSVMEYSQLDPRVSNYWRSDNDFNGTDGAFSLTLGKHYRDKNQQGWRIAVSADGYTVQEKFVRVDATSPVRLEYKLEVGNQPTGKLTTQSGIPIPRAEIALLINTGDQGYYTVFNGRLREYPGVAAKAITAPDGSFRLRALGKKGILLALTNEGYAIANYTPGSTEPLHLTLTPWGQLSGALTRNSGLSVQGQRMSVSTSVKHGEIGVSFVSAVQTNQSGQYHFPRVAAGDNGLQYVLTHTQGNVSSSGRAGPQLTTAVQAGEPTTLNYDARGMDVTGEVDLSALGDAYQWERGNVFLTAVNPAEVLKDTPNADLDILYYIFYVAEDGTFRINGVLPGVYNIRISLYEPNNPFADPSAVGEATITVPEGKPGEVFDAGAIKLHLHEEAKKAILGTD